MTRRRGPRDGPPPWERSLADSFAVYCETMLPPDASDDVVAACQHAWAFGMSVGIGYALRELAPPPGPVDPHRRPADVRADLADVMEACIVFAGPSPAKQAQ